MVLPVSMHMRQQQLFGKLNNLMSDLKSQAYYQNNELKREIKSYCFLYEIVRD